MFSSNVSCDAVASCLPEVLAVSLFWVLNARLISLYAVDWVRVSQNIFDALIKAIFTLILKIQHIANQIIYTCKQFFNDWNKTFKLQVIAKLAVYVRE